MARKNATSMTSRRILAACENERCALPPYFMASTDHATKNTIQEPPMIGPEISVTRGARPQDTDLRDWSMRTLARPRAGVAACTLAARGRYKQLHDGGSHDVESDP